MGQVLIWGSCYAEIERDEAGRVKGLWPLLSKDMEVKRIDGELVYLYRTIDGGIKIFSSRNILRINGFSPNGITGLNPIQKLKEPIGLGLALEEYGARFFGTGAKPPAVLEHPGTLGTKTKDLLRKAWEEMHQGLSGAHRIAILEEGMKLHEYGVSPEDAQALESRKFQVTEIARIFNMPPHMLKDLERASFNNIEMMSLEFVIYTLRPWLVRFEQAYNTQLFNQKEQKKYFLEHLVDGLLRGDIKTRHEAYTKGRQWGYLSANDIRELENLNPIEGGDVYLVPLNMIPADQVGQMEPPKKEEKPKEEKSIEVRAKSPLGRDRIVKQYHPLFKDAAQRIVNREGIAIKKAIKKYTKERSKTDIEKWLKEFYDEMPSYIQKQIGPVIRSFSEAIQAEAATEIGGEVGVSEELERFINDYIEGYSQRHIESSLGQLIALLEEEIEAIEQRVNEWAEKRPDKIANNETTRASNAIAQFVFWSAGFSAVWRIRGPKTCPYCRSLEGKKVKRGDAFIDPGTDLKPEGVEKPMKVYGLTKHPPLHAGCDCYISVV
jgi:HK97 family phage portal protein